jgi:hypothetical protein
MKCELTDGAEIFETREMTAAELISANHNAAIATDGNIYWITRDKKPAPGPRENAA